MKILPLMLLSAIAGAPALASADASFVRADAALANLEHLSPDGCVHTVAELVLLSAQGGELAPGVYIVGSQEDVCSGTGMGFATLAESTPAIFSLLYAHYAGTVVAESYSGGAPITFEIDLDWLGSGKISREHSVLHDESGLSISFGASRNARTRGYVRADGVAISVTSASLRTGASGTITR